VVIRSGEIEFEVDSFDAAVATVTKLVNGLKGGFVATVNSDKLLNGKMKGAVVVRVPPELLDGLVLDLRKELAKGGELKGQRIGSQDITKQYTDLESRLKAAHTMEQRLLQIIKEGKGDIKVLLEAEKELGVWRTKIEEMEGELRYYAHQVALSSLTVTLVEKEIKAAAGLTENERVQAGVEVEEVEAAFRQLLAAVAEAKGRVTKSELKQLAAGQFNAALHFEMSPDAAGPIRDRLRQLGRIARLEIDRIQQPDAGTVQKDAKVRRGDTKFEVQLYNLANVAPRETAIIQVAVPDVPAAYQALREVVAKATGRVIVAQLNEQDRQNITAQLDFDIRRSEDGPIGAALAAAGEVVARQVNRTPDSDNVTDSRVLYRTNFVSASRLKPRETTTLTLEVQDVDAAVAVLGARVAEARGRQVDSSVARERNGQVTAKAVIDVPLLAAAGFVEQLKGAGVVRVQKAMKDPQAPDGRYATARVEVTLSTAEGIVEGDGSLWPPVKRGLSVSASVLLTSLTWVIFGLCVVLPWAVVGYGGYRLVRRLTGTRSAPTPVSGGPA
jgi:glycine cleavage system regulatory protein